jgi:hypothetical protein
MKKILFVLLLLTILSSSSIVTAEDSADIIEKGTGIDINKIPTSADDLKNEYLKEEWTKVIANNTILGPIHRTFEKSSLIFSIFFAHPYEVSLLLFSILVLWVFILYHSSKIIESAGLAKGGIALLVGVAITTIIAQLRIIKIIVTFALDTILKQENWPTRLILTVVILGAIVLAHILSKMGAKELEKQKKAKKESESDQAKKEVKALAKGLRS